MIDGLRFPLGGSREPASHGLFERLYLRLGSRYVSVLLLAAGASVPALAIPASALAIPYLELSSRGYLSAMAVVLPWTILLGIAVELGVRRRLEPLLRWLRTGRDRAGVSEAWHAAVIGLPRAVMTGGAIAIVGAVPVEVYVAVDAGGKLAGALAAIAGITVFILAATGLHYLVWERAFRPVVLELAGLLPDGFRVEQNSLSISSRLLLLIPLMNVITAFIAGAAASADLSPAGRTVMGLAVSVGVTVVVALPLTIMLRRSMLVPLHELLRAMDRVQHGNLDAPLPLVAADEIGTVAEHFNSMLAGLREREQLSGQNEQLQAQVRAQLDEVRASRARIIAASDAERKRVERNIHDGAQQRLVALALELRLLEAEAGSSGNETLREKAAAAGVSLSEALGELRDLARGLHPQILSTDGLRPALQQLGERAPVPVKVEAPDDRFPDPIESTAYFIVSEALANVGKYAQASAAEVSVERRNGALHVEVADDGVGGADPDSGSGLSGLKDRVAALDGSLEVQSEAGGGTKVRAQLPLKATPARGE